MLRKGTPTLLAGLLSVYDRERGALERGPTVVGGDRWLDC